jgi:hypothetical protein
MELAQILGLPPRLVDREPWADSALLLQAYYDRRKGEIDLDIALHGGKRK